ncbi:TetR/AcrR family transcriptional regulator [Streptomyces sp. NY05-11A]|uniref:TetR/AcrR family transcriptional regulator n=1 Tax=Streptomyces soliscabiei TaxID=588897 RepID=UPI0029B33E42|nr:helix-turn-helix domain-containing protein [Streptomyces sp. NY05-11A]MDX2677579.1 helix-turn-helix domain containing protein [Streptomyces sp. NY05-11A]
MTQVRPIRADARRNYERLLRAAAEAFAEQGENASLDDIAKRAGVGSGTLYRHFPNRHALLEAAYVGRIEELAARAGDLAEELPPGEALVAWLNEVCVTTLQVRGLKALMGSAVTETGPVAVTACGTVLKQASAALVEAAQREGTLRADIEPIDVLRLAHGVATASELANGDSSAIRRYVSLLTEGLRPAR